MKYRFSRTAPLMLWILMVAVVPAQRSLAAESLAPAIRSSVTTSTDTAPRLAVISAFDAELEKLRGEAEISETRVINGRTFYLGRLAGNDVVLLLSGMSMVNAAMTTQTLFDNFNVKGVVFSGIAGGVNPNLHVGDVTVPVQWGEYQEFLFARAAGDGWDTGRFKAEFANYGMMFPHAVQTVRKDQKPDTLERRFWFSADPALLEVARLTAGQVHLKRCTPRGECLGSEPKVVVGGNGVSGATFVDNAAYRVYVWDTFKADALDMETAAVAHVAYVNRVPYIAFRSLSDLAGGGPGKNEGAVFSRLAADNAATVVLSYLGELAQRSKQ